jgi:DNA-binding beta-propeller fold protein YncE
VLTAVVAMGSLSVPVYADEHYDVYNYDTWGEAIPSQAGYLAERSVSGEDLGIEHFSSPSDIFKDDNDYFYLCDTGNNRIVVLDSELSEVVKIYDEFTGLDGKPTTLNNPMGVFVDTENQYIYIADNKNSRVIKSDMDGNIVFEYTKPTSEVYPQELTFLPQKVLVDSAGYVYIVVNNITSGAVMYKNDGEFVGFYGANKVKQTAEVISNYLWSLVSTDEQLASRSRSVPVGFNNFDIDDEGFIYTCTQSENTDIVKKVNPAGDDLFESVDVTWGDDTTLTDTTKTVAMTDIDISDNGYINCLDLTTGRVFQYDEECNLMFILGGTSEQLGGFEKVTALESKGNDIYVVDGLKNTITVFTETEFGSIVHEATDLYNDGYYEQALSPWYEVLKRDGNYRRAYLGIASAKLNSGEYAEAMKYAKLADNGSIYNKAFEGYRQDWLDSHFGLVSFVIILLVLIWLVNSILKRVKKITLFELLKESIKSWKVNNNLKKRGAKV